MIAPELPIGGFGLFGDEVFTSTDLNRRSAEVLNRARKHPVTIARNNEQFALLRRDQAANLIKAVGQMREVIDLFQATVSASAGVEPPPHVAWVKELDEDDRTSMLKEVLAECSRVSANGDWEALGDLIHAWRESAAVVRSGVLDRVLAEPADEQPATVPNNEQEPRAGTTE